MGFNSAFKVFKKQLKNFLWVSRCSRVDRSTGLCDGQYGVPFTADDFSVFSRPALVPTKLVSHEYTVRKSCSSAGSKAWAIKLNTHLRVMNQQSYIFTPSIRLY